MRWLGIRRPYAAEAVHCASRPIEELDDLVRQRVDEALRSGECPVPLGSLVDGSPVEVNASPHKCSFVKAGFRTSTVCCAICS